LKKKQSSNWKEDFRQSCLKQGKAIAAEAEKEFLWSKASAEEKKKIFSKALEFMISKSSEHAQNSYDKKEEEQKLKERDGVSLKSYIWGGYGQ